MKLAQFEARWCDYSDEQIQTYKVLHGDDREDWPRAEHFDKIVIDLDRLVRFNPGNSELLTTVELNCGGCYMLCINYEEFKEIILANSIDIIDYTSQCTK